MAKCFSKIIMLLPCQTQMIQLNLVFSMAAEQQLKAMLLPRTSTERQSTPHPIALAVIKSLPVFISKYVLKRSLQRKL